MLAMRPAVGRLAIRRPSQPVSRTSVLKVHAKTTGGKNKGNDKKGNNALAEHPVLSRVLDGPLIMGDAVMVTATELSSQRIPMDEDMKYLLGVAVVTWLMAGLALGDYRGRMPESNNLYVSMVLGPVFIAVCDATVTWAVAALLSIIPYSYLVQGNMIDPAPLMDGLGTDDLSPQLEIAVAALIIMPCWRGIVTKLRTRS